MPSSILVADDNPAIRKTLCRIFELEEDYEICAEAANGVEAIVLALKHRPELIILDLSMPVMNGLDTARELKRLMPAVPIILFTQHASYTSRWLDVDRVVDRIVSKSNPVDLMGHVRSLLPPPDAVSPR
ncbi:MAG TPA: response regulator transcription factor [Candidatus Acidoferrales bacterium]